MKYLLVLISCIVLTSCSKNTINDIDVRVGRQNSFNTEHLSFVINAEYEGDFGVNYEDFVLEIIVTATPIVNVSSEEEWIESVSKPTLTQIITLTQDNFTACQGKMVHGIGYKFNDVTKLNQQSGYILSFTKSVN